MSDKITLDENGKISDSDKLYDLLDEWHDNDEYDRIIKAVLGVPEEQRSVKLRFRLISAYNNKKEFGRAHTELTQVFPMCKTPAERAKFFYMNGYIHYMEDKEMAAYTCYRLGVETDPENTSELDLESECADCREYIDKDLKKLAAVAEKAVGEIGKSCSKKTEKLEVSDEKFTMIIGFLPGVRQIPGLNRALRMDEYFLKFEGREKEIMKEWLANAFGITDKFTFLNFYRQSRGCNVAGMAEDVRQYIETGTAPFELNKADSEVRLSFLNAVDYMRPFVKYLPKAGMLAWDIAEKIGFCRCAYSCDILTNSDYTAAMLYLHDTAKEQFASAEEFCISLVFGGAMCMFAAEAWNIKGSMDFIIQISNLLIHGDLPDLKWK